ncbi:MAG: universal stress protein [Bacteroidales bacterium]
MKQKIIQFVRSTENLEKVIDSAIPLVNALDLELNLVMVLETRNAYYYPMTSTLNTSLETYQFEKMRNDQIKKEKKSFEKVIRKKQKENKNPVISYEIKEGATDMILIDMSEDPETYLIMISESHEPEQGFIINTYLNIVERASCPILKIPKNYHLADLKRILYATDYKEEDISTLTRLASIAAPFKGIITALHITDSVDLEEKLKSHGFESSLHDKVGYDRIHFAIREEKNVVRGILEYAEKGEYDLIVLLKENRNFLQRLFTRSESNRILSEATIPVMIYHEPT